MSGGGGEGGAHVHSDLVFIHLILALFFALLIRNQKIVPFPFTVSMIIVGSIMGALNHAGALGNKFGNALVALENIDPHLILIVFLPPLIFESAFSIDTHILRKIFWQPFMLATSGMVFSAVLTAAVCVSFFDYNLSFSEGMLFGAILSATDPVAVVSLMKSLGASERLVTVIEGESLLNDGTAVVLFIALKDALSTEDTGIDLKFGSLTLFFFRMAIGGPLLGFLWGKLTTAALAWVLNDAVTEIAITIFSCYSLFAISESLPAPLTGHPPFVSGVLATVALGLYMSSHGKSRITPEVEHQLHDFWAMLSWLMNAVIFYLSGAIIVEKGVYEFDAIRGVDFGYCILLWLMLQIIRFFVVGLHYPLLKRASEYGFTPGAAAVLAWGGLRGAVGLSLALITEGDSTIDEELRDRVLFHTAGVALLSLLINGTTTELLLKLVNLDAVGRAEADAFLSVCKEVDQNTDKFIEHLKLDPYLGSCSFNKVWLYLPVYSRELYIRRAAMVEKDASSMPRRLKSRWQRYEQKYSRKMLKDGKLMSTKRLSQLPKVQEGPEISSGFLFRHARGSGWSDRAVLKVRNWFQKMCGFGFGQPRLHGGLPLSVKLKDCFTKREEELAEMKRRLVAIRRSEYHHLFGKGLVSPDAFDVLVNAGKMELEESTPRSAWQNISDSMNSSRWLTFFYNTSRFTRLFVSHSVSKHIGVSFENASSFLRANTHILETSEFQSLHHSEVLENEIKMDCEHARAFIADIEVAYPDLLLSYKTKICARAACMNERIFAAKLYSMGRTEDRENNALVGALRSSLKKVAYHPLRTSIKTRPAFLHSVSFLDCVELAEGLEAFGEKCEETLHRKHDEIIAALGSISSVVIVRHGIAKAVKRTASDSDKMLEAGSHLGLLGWTGHSVEKQGRLIGQTDCTLLSIRIADLEALCNSWPQLALGVARECAIEFFLGTLGDDLSLSASEFASALNHSTMGINASAERKSTSISLDNEIGFLVRGKVKTRAGAVFKAPAILNRKIVGKTSNGAADFVSASPDAVLLLSHYGDFPSEVGCKLTDFADSSKSKASSSRNPISSRPQRKRHQSAWSRMAQGHKF